EVDRERGDVGEQLVETQRGEQAVVLAPRVRVEEADVRVGREVAGATGHDAQDADGRGAGAEEVLLPPGREPHVAQHRRGERRRLVQVELEPGGDVTEAGRGAAGGGGCRRCATAVERVRRGRHVRANL